MQYIRKNKSIITQALRRTTAINSSLTTIGFNYNGLYY